MGMQTSPSILLLSRLNGTLGAQDYGEDTYLAEQGFLILDLHGSVGYFYL